MKRSLVKHIINRISHLSANKSIVNKHIDTYRIELNKAGYKINSNYTKNIIIKRHKILYKHNNNVINVKIKMKTKLEILIMPTRKYHIRNVLIET